MLEVIKNNATHITVVARSGDSLIFFIKLIINRDPAIRNTIMQKNVTALVGNILPFGTKSMLIALYGRKKKIVGITPK